MNCLFFHPFSFNQYALRSPVRPSTPNRSDVRYSTAFVYRLPTLANVTLSSLGLQECQAIAKSHEKLVAACFCWPNSALSAKENIQELRYTYKGLLFHSLPCSDPCHPFCFYHAWCTGMHELPLPLCLDYVIFVTKPMKICICSTSKCNRNVCDNSPFKHPALCSLGVPMCWFRSGWMYWLLLVQLI